MGCMLLCIPMSSRKTVPSDDKYDPSVHLHECTGHCGRQPTDSLHQSQEIQDWSFRKEWPYSLARLVHHFAKCQQCSSTSMWEVWRIAIKFEDDRVLTRQRFVTVVSEGLQSAGIDSSEYSGQFSDWSCYYGGCQGNRRLHHQELRKRGELGVPAIRKDSSYSQLAGYSNMLVS